MDQPRLDGPAGVGASGCNPTPDDSSKPQKPTSDFPLFAHASGKWAKKIRGKTSYFGCWSDPAAALAEYSSKFSVQLPAHLIRFIESGGQQQELTLSQAVNLFLTAKQQAVQLRELSKRSLREYERTCERLIDLLSGGRAVASLSPEDFDRFRVHRAATCNVVSVGNEVTRVKTMFKWLAKMKHCPELEMGPTFRKPSVKVVRRIRREAGKKLYSAEEVLRIADEAGVHLRAMILLAINTGFQNTDCETIPLEVLQVGIETGWIDFPREKTEVDRRCPLWKITRRALQRSLKRRPSSSCPNFWVLPNGKPYSSVNGDVSKRFRAARDHAQITRGGFSWLRKTFATVGSSCGDQVAVNAIMGHVDSSISAVYRQEVQDDRLLKVTREVRKWLASPEDKATTRGNPGEYE